MLKRGLPALERGRRSAREQLGRTAVAYAVLAVALVLTGLAYYYVRHNVEQAERERFEETARATEQAVDRGARRSPAPEGTRRGPEAGRGTLSRKSRNELCAADGGRDYINKLAVGPSSSAQVIRGLWRKPLST